MEVAAPGSYERGRSFRSRTLRALLLLADNPAHASGQCGALPNRDGYSPLAVGRHGSRPAFSHRNINWQ